MSHCAGGGGGGGAPFGMGSETTTETQIDLRRPGVRRCVIRKFAASKFNNAADLVPDNPNRVGLVVCVSPLSAGMLMVLPSNRPGGSPDEDPTLDYGIPIMPGGCWSPDDEADGPWQGAVRAVGTLSAGVTVLEYLKE